MLKNYLISALRNLKKHGIYTVINIFGLAIGLSLCLIVVGNIVYELSFEDIHKNKKSIYRVNGSYRLKPDEKLDIIRRFGGSDEYEITHIHSAKTMGTMGKAIADGIPEVESAAVFRIKRIDNLKIDNERFLIKDKYAGQAYAHHNIMIFADPHYFQVFSFTLIQGSPSAMDEPFTVFISEKARGEYFPGQNPIGKVVRINDRFECRIAGILRDIPQNTQLKTDFIVSYSTLDRIGEDIQAWNFYGSDYVYLLLRKDALPGAVEEKLPGFASNLLESSTAANYTLSLQPLKKVYFSSLLSNRQNELDPMGEVSVIIAMGIVALFVLVQAVANFINLATARTAERTREVGIRKVFGAYRKQLIAQFLGESIIITFISLIVSIGLYELFKISVQDSLPRQMFVDFYSSPWMMAAVAALLVLVGVAAGFYPALYLSRFSPLTILQTKTSVKSTKSLLRKCLVVFQFGITAVFILCAIVIYRQTHFLLGINLGFDKENIVVFDFDGENTVENCQLVKNEILRKTDAVSATVSNSPPGRRGYSFYGFYTGEERLDENRITVKLFDTDYDFLNVFNLKIAQGREFDQNSPADINHALLITETGAKALDADNPVGYRLYGKDKFYEIVGVVEDFQGTTLDYYYKPISLIRLRPDAAKILSVKLPQGDIKKSLNEIGRVWETTLPGEPFIYSFLDEEIDRNYSELRGQMKMFFALSLLTIAIACLGIFGLVSYTAARRTREIGIRKILGASVQGIVAALSKEFIILIAIANVLAFPIAYLMMKDFLQYYPFRISVGVGTFAFAALMTIALALTAAGYNSVKAAAANPVESLRYE